MNVVFIVSSSWSEKQIRVDKIVYLNVNGMASEQYNSRQNRTSTKTKNFIIKEEDLIKLKVYQKHWYLMKKVRTIRYMILMIIETEITMFIVICWKDVPISKPLIVDLKFVLKCSNNNSKGKKFTIWIPNPWLIS